MTAHGEMNRHFEDVSSVYRGVRTTDAEPVRLIADQLDGAGPLRAADIGCGAGRYDLLLFKALPGLRLTCIDPSAAMLAQVGALLADNGIDDFETTRSTVETMVLEPACYDAVTSFNAVHHFDFPTFLGKVRDGLKRDGHLFIYTRLPEHNARNIWGRHFPDFADKETRLYRLSDMYEWIDACDGLRFASATCFRYPRRASLVRLVEQARAKHYSTFSLYPPAEFEDALARFETEIRARFNDLDAVEWDDENVLVHARRTAE